MTKVWALSSGEYSDYRVEFIFSTKKKAKFFKKTAEENGQYYNNIEEYTLDPKISIKQYKFKHWYSGAIDVNGDGYVNQEEVAITKGGHTYQYHDHDKYYFVSDYGYGPQEYNIKLRFSINADDRDQAWKKVGEIRSKMLRDGVWPTKEQIKQIEYKEFDPFAPYAVRIIGQKSS